MIPTSALLLFLLPENLFVSFFKAKAGSDINHNALQ